MFNRVTSLSVLFSLTSSLALAAPGLGEWIENDALLGAVRGTSSTHRLVQPRSSVDVVNEGMKRSTTSFERMMEQAARHSRSGKFFQCVAQTTLPGGSLYHYEYQYGDNSQLDQSGYRRFTLADFGIKAFEPEIVKKPVDPDLGIIGQVISVKDGKVRVKIVKGDTSGASHEMDTSSPEYRRYERVQDEVNAYSDSMVDYLYDRAGLPSHTYQEIFGIQLPAPVSAAEKRVLLVEYRRGQIKVPHIHVVSVHPDVLDANEELRTSLDKGVHITFRRVLSELIAGKCNLTDWDPVRKVASVPLEKKKEPKITVPGSLIAKFAGLDAGVNLRTVVKRNTMTDFQALFQQRYGVTDADMKSARTQVAFWAFVPEVVMADVRDETGPGISLHPSLPQAFGWKKFFERHPSMAARFIKGQKLQAGVDFAAGQPLWQAAHVLKRALWIQSLGVRSQAGKEGYSWDHSLPNGFNLSSFLAQNPSLVDRWAKPKGLVGVKLTDEQLRSRAGWVQAVAKKTMEGTEGGYSWMPGVTKGFNWKSALKRDPGLETRFIKEFNLQDHKDIQGGKVVGSTQVRKLAEWIQTLEAKGKLK